MANTFKEGKATRPEPKNISLCSLAIPDLKIILVIIFIIIVINDCLNFNNLNYHTIFFLLEADLSNSLRYSDPFKLPVLFAEASILKVIGLFVRISWSFELIPNYFVYFKLILPDK